MLHSDPDNDWISQSILIISTSTNSVFYASHTNPQIFRFPSLTHQLESMIRISEGLARMHFRSEVLRSDVIEAVRLMKAALQVGEGWNMGGCVLMLSKPFTF